MRIRTQGLAVAVAAALASCGGGGGGDTDAEQGGSSSTSGNEADLALDDLDAPVEEPTVHHTERSAIELMGISGPDAPWQGMSHEDREMYMVGKVLPIAHELFMRLDENRYREFTCESCHGRDGRERRFEMPSNDLPVIPEEGTRGYDLMLSTYPEISRFMREELTPTTGTLLGIEGFSCHGCHRAPD